MGTRHLQTVIDKIGRYKLNQYGQWDGYPSYQGVKLLHFLRDNDLEVYEEQVSKLRHFTEEEVVEIEKLDDAKLEESFPQLNRDTGYKIHDLIYNGQVNKVFLATFEDTRYCVVKYTVNFLWNIFTIEYNGYVWSYELNNLPSDDDFLKRFNKVENYE